MQWKVTGGRGPKLWQKPKTRRESRGGVKDRTPSAAVFPVIAEIYEKALDLHGVQLTNTALQCNEKGADSQQSSKQPPNIESRRSIGDDWLRITHTFPSTFSGLLVALLGTFPEPADPEANLARICTQLMNSCWSFLLALSCQMPRLTC